MPRQDLHRRMKASQRTPRMAHQSSAVARHASERGQGTLKGVPINKVNWIAEHFAVALQQNRECALISLKSREIETMRRAARTFRALSLPRSWRGQVRPRRPIPGPWSRSGPKVRDEMLLVVTDQNGLAGLVGNWRFERRSAHVSHSRSGSSRLNNLPRWWTRQRHNGTERGDRGSGSAPVGTYEGANWPSS